MKHGEYITVPIYTDNKGVKINMYVYIKTERFLWTVGFYSPDGEWNPESDYDSKYEAAERVHWLNGGKHG